MHLSSLTLLTLSWAMYSYSHYLFLSREEDFTKSMYPSLNGSSNSQPRQHPDQKKVNLICDVMRVAMEHIDPQK